MTLITDILIIKTFQIGLFMSYKLEVSTVLHQIPTPQYIVCRSQKKLERIRLSEVFHSVCLIYPDQFKFKIRNNDS